MVQDLRRTFVHGSSLDEARGRLCGDVADACLPARAARVLRREGSKHQGRIAEAKGFPQGNGRLRSIADGVGGLRGGAQAARRRGIDAGYIMRYIWRHVWSRQTSSSRASLGRRI